MKCQIRLFILIWSLILLLVILTLTVGACEPHQFFIRVQNQTDMTLTLFWVAYPRGDIAKFARIKPGEEFTHTGLWSSDRYSILAVNERGEFVYSRSFTRQELDDIDWIVVIRVPPRKSDSSHKLPIQLVRCYCLSKSVKLLV